MVDTISITPARMREGCIPIAGIVALCAVCAENPGMDRRFGVTGSASCREPAVNTTGVTLCTVQSDVRTSQWESRQIVVKCCRQPAARGMARGAVFPEPAIMSVILLVAEITIGGCTLKVVIDMTVLTGNRGVFAGQFEGEQIVIDVDWQPASGGVAGGAICSELVFVFIILLMAGIAISRCALVDVIDMAIPTSDGDMLTGQFECG